MNLKSSVVSLSLLCAAYKDLDHDPICFIVHVFLFLYLFHIFADHSVLLPPRGLHAQAGDLVQDL